MKKQVVALKAKNAMMIDRELFAQFEKFLESQGMKIVSENPSVSTQTEVNNLKVFRGRLIN